MAGVHRGRHDRLITPPEEFLPLLLQYGWSVPGTFG
jgi:hypothetical protein